MKRCLTDEHGFWGMGWLIALCVSLLWDAALHRTPDAVITLLDVTALILCLAVGCRVQMGRSHAFRCWSSLVIYLTTHWVRDWLLILLVSFVTLPWVGFLLQLMHPGSGGPLLLLTLYGLLTAAIPTGKLIRNMRRLRTTDEPDELWRFEEAPRWIWN